jgi:hypothetical protein
MQILRAPVDLTESGQCLGWNRQSRTLQLFSSEPSQRDAQLSTYAPESAQT